MGSIQMMLIENSFVFIFILNIGDLYVFQGKQSG